MFRIYRPLEKGEFIVVGGDCSQGGADSNFVQFMSKTKLDIPVVYELNDVAANMTAAIYPMLNKTFDLTGIKPVIALERNNGGASEMQRLVTLNREQKYVPFVMPKLGDENPLASTDKLGWDTNAVTRPILVGDWKAALDTKLITIYDEETINQHKRFVVNSNGKPEASKGSHDDAVISCAIAYQLFQRCYPQKAVTGQQVQYEDRPFGVSSMDAYR